MTFDSNAEWNIPHIHFMVDKTDSGNYEATLLEFGLVSWSESLEVDDQVMDGYWRYYRKIEFSLAPSNLIYNDIKDAT